MKRIQVIKKLIADAENRLRRATIEVGKINSELVDLRVQFETAIRAEQQLPLPLENPTRGLSDKWASVLGYMLVRRPNPVSIEEILQFAAENDLSITRAAARAQLYNYTQRGLVERLNDGLFKATIEAQDFCD